MMFNKQNAEHLFEMYGFNQTLKNDETIKRTAKAFNSNEYTVANGPKGRNRLNSGILRNQFILLLDSLNGKSLTDYQFTGVSLLHNDQYVLVHQNPEKELWEVYQGNSPNNPQKIYDNITLQSFFDSLKDKDVAQNKELESSEKRSLIFPLRDENEFTAGLSEDQIIQKIAECLKEEYDLYKNTRLSFFGFKYGNIIGKLNRAVSKIVMEAQKLDESINKSAIENVRYGLRIFKNALHEGCIGKASVSEKQEQTPFFSDLDDFQLGEEMNYRQFNFSPIQKIYYGVPGCGKSRKIKEKLTEENADEEMQVIRCVFHPEYTNADFVGQIFPVAKEGKGVEYKFKAGPFAEILRRAYLNPDKKFFLVIEEINRGNAAAIFGEMFQLLDRIKPGEKDQNGFTAGWSSYSILNDDVNDYIRNIEAFQKFAHSGCQKANHPKEMMDGDGNPVDSAEPNGEKFLDLASATSYSSLELSLQGFSNPQAFRESTGIRLPPNLSIYATMNASDQNVFTLDNAFRRRFDSELVKNSLDGDEHKAQRETKIEGANITWGTFWKRINELILEKHSSMTSSEDKRLGAYFIMGEEKKDGDNTCREIPKKLFGEKVLEYLWNDAFKYKRKEVFQEDCKSVESLIEKFEKDGFSGVFKNLNF